MNSKRKFLKDCCLYVVIDKKRCASRSLIDIATKIKKGGVSIFQLRDKESKKEIILKDALALRKLLFNEKIIFIINDYLDIAKIVDSDGIHLGQDDPSIEVTRRLLGKDKIIGISCHNLDQALKAQAQGADYISIGPIFPTSIKPESKAIGLDLIKEHRGKIKIPFFAIGGINENNINQVISSGAKRVAICQAICQGENIPLVLRKLFKILD